VAFNDPLQWILIGAFVIVVVVAYLIYSLGKAKGQIKGMKDAQAQKTT
jgi:hypothetical protein